MAQQAESEVTIIDFNGNSHETDRQKRTSSQAERSRLGLATQATTNSNQQHKLTRANNKTQACEIEHGHNIFFLSILL
ncbi:hypothetical protein BpHYR1_025537 [Brachionus plicatilis]|uniref:Uncharacterized protein n=1 Tax=Brachionus plicatilis TaxID=10195 RepID=A0A3M7SMK1_BRAPC|nr:hypothetical protein BpHYR1_025537 [Brachionus plicatilis]